MDQYVSIAWKLRRLGAAERDVFVNDWDKECEEYLTSCENYHLARAAAE